MKKSLIGLSIATLSLIVLAYFLGGTELVLDGLQKALKTVQNSGLMIIVSFILIGQLLILVSKESINKWLKHFSGVKGIIVSSLVGGLFPGGPYLYYPFINSFHGQDMPFYLLISFVYGKYLYDFTRIPMEASLIDPKIAVIRYLITLPLPLLAALITRRIFRDRSFSSISPQKAILSAEPNAGEGGAVDADNDNHS